MKDEIKAPPKEIKGLKVWCPVCKTEVRECLKNGKPLEKCENGEKLSYRVVVYYEGSRQRKVVHLETKDLHEAIRAWADIRKEVKERKPEVKELNAVKKVEKRRAVIEEVKEAENELKLLDGMSYYINFLKGERGFEHERCHPRSPKHCADVEKSFTLFGKAMIKNEIDVEAMKVNDIGGQEVGFFHTYLLKDMEYGAHSYNRNLTNLSSLINYLNSHEKQHLDNPFSRVIRKHTETKVTIIKPSEFQTLLSVIKRENGYKIMKDGKKRIFYYDFLPTAFKLALLSGIRREPLAYLRYNDVHENENCEPIAIISKNMKVNRIQASRTGVERTIPTPVTPPLKRLLYDDLNYEANRGSDRFLIGNDSGLKRSFIVSVLSKSFAHFWKQTGINKEAEFSNLRDLFINRMQLALGDNSRFVTGHASKEIMDNHYLSKDFFADVVSKENIFPELEIGEKEERQKEISKARSLKQKEEKEISIER